MKACARRIKLLPEGDLHTEIVVDDYLKEVEILTTAARELTVSLNALIQESANRVKDGANQMAESSSQSVVNTKE